MCMSIGIYSEIKSQYFKIKIDEYIVKYICDNQNINTHFKHAQASCDDITITDFADIT